MKKDYRLKENRREAFLKFYEFHLRYRSHPGGVYQLIPYFSEKYKWSTETCLWAASLNALTQYWPTTIALMQRAPAPLNEAEWVKFDEWFQSSWYSLPFDSDRKWQKVECPKAVRVLSEKAKEYGSLQNFYTGDFKTLWGRARNELHSLGRLGAWSGLEFIKIAGRGVLDFEYDTLMLRDMSGSKSHRNGLCILLGHDELDWHDKLNPEFDGKYSGKMLSWLEREGEALLVECRGLFKYEDFIADVGYETLESALCCYKSWHRPNRRYPSVYNDMLYSRLLETAEKNPSLDLTPFWEARAKYLPERLRIECNKEHPQYGSKTLSKKLQNLYRETGQIPFIFD
jgi:hypothetical protein